MARMLTSEDTANIRNMLQDPDAGGDVLFWLYATVAYAVLRASGWGESDAARGLQLMRPETAAGVGQLAESAFRPV